MSKNYTVRALTRDKEMFAQDFESEEAIKAAAALWNAMRKLQAATGPGFAPLDVLTRGIPKKHLRNWAKRLLEEAA